MLIRKSIRFLKKNFFSKKVFIPFLGLLLFVFLFYFYFSPKILKYFEQTYHQKFVFFDVGEPFLALIRFSLFLTFITFFPLIWLIFSQMIKFVFGLNRKFFLFFFFSGLFLFYGGMLFAYKITLPYGIKFLLSFGGKKIIPSISVSHFVNFFSFFLVAFGLIFELPLIMCLFSLTGLGNVEKLRHYRKEVFFVIVVVAAIITPTPDAFNLFLLTAPLYVLFELGLFLSRIAKNFNTASEECQKGLQKTQQPSQEA